ncbi:hypothetical protein [Paenibacillus agricola]|uniref:hypothetical protein n=1 Tax=Paenibacillus agricola TaxID=2716264 RepID=UPI001A9D4A86|nr:hypothetical protein [Paenibacillus agricola]
MNRMNHLDQVNWIAQLADLKHTHYHNSLLLSALIELLVEKGIMTAQDIAIMSAQLDASLTPHVFDAMHSPQSDDASHSSQPIDAMYAQHSVEASLSSQPIDAMRAQHSEASLSSQPIDTMRAQPSVEAPSTSHADN